jgi:hypothetical protein
MKDYVCEPLGNHHHRTQFDCGVSVLNDYLAKYAKQDVKRKASAVFVLVEREQPKRVIGYYTLCATSVALAELPEELTGKLPRYPEIHAITRCVRVASEIAASLIVVDSKGEAATRFYEKFGFISLPNLSDRMFLPMQTAEKL